MYRIPLFDLNYDEREIEAVVETLKTKWISAGPKCNELEEKFARMLGVKYACAISNCTAALHLACRVAGLGEGDEVICPSLTFAATVNCIRYVGATPVFCDIVSTRNLCMDAAKIEDLITDKTKAIIPMHYGGFPCDMDRIMEIAQKHNLYVIEDACHGPMSEYHGAKVGTIGDIGCFSFFSNKNISTGEGGIMVTNNEDIYNRLKLLRSHGMTTMSYQRATGHATSYDIVELGYNYRFDDIRASLACVQLDKLEGDLEKRRLVRQWYEKNLQGAEEVDIPFQNSKEFSSNYIFPIVLKNSTAEYRNFVRDELQKKGIQTSIHYPAIHKFSAYQKYTKNLPITEYVTDNEVTLPMYAKLEEDDIVYICDSLKEILKNTRCRNNGKCI